MANSRSARKRIRASERKHERNRAVRSAVRTRINKVRRSLITGQAPSIEEELHAAIKALDKAAEKGILHRNNVRRRKSRIAAMAARLTRFTGSEEELAAARAVAAGGVKGRTTKAGATAKPAAAKPTAKAAAKTPVKVGAGKAPATKAAAKTPVKVGAGKAPATKAAAKTSATKAPAKATAKAGAKPDAESAEAE